MDFIPLYKDIFDDSIKVKIDFEYFYILKNKENNDEPAVPNYVFKDFSKFFDMLMLVEKGGKQGLFPKDGWQPGRISAKDFFSSRLPYLKRFLNKEHESLYLYDEMFSILPKPTLNMTKLELDKLEYDIFSLLRN